MVKYEMCIVIGFLLLAIPLASASLEDASYYYTSGMLSEAKTMFAEASDDYSKCIEISTELKDLCEAGLERVTGISTTKTRDLSIANDMLWTFRGEKSGDGFIQYFLTGNSDTVVIRVYKLDYNLDEDDISFLLERQKTEMSASYTIEQSELTHKGIKIKYLLGSQGELSNFVGMYFDSSSNELYSISASVSDTKKFLDNFKAEESAIGAPVGAFFGLGETTTYAFVAVIIIILVIIILIKKKSL
ncbi:MAG: hypothetical protein ISS36_01160 [Candidatus Aenigmarchaeota archaeon]|nr:hypothetical protein [Candidatus Aenigmarchaeota archaeon]